MSTGRNLKLPERQIIKKHTIQCEEMLWRRFLKCVSERDITQRMATEYALEEFCNAHEEETKK